MSQVKRIDDETLGCFVGGKFIFAYDWVIRNYFDINYDLNDYSMDEFVKECNLVKIYKESSDDDKLEIFGIIKDDFILYQDEDEWLDLVDELEDAYMGL